ncbi:hypothetical protein SAMN05660845_1121 [Flavobacterium swingsii]|jgi:hypothetical protein|uniref:Uncharacterized protein n=1 Tax=Flavobacterium swingsii TaxID=498292 RepID=A0A1I0XAF7_9FLAO|nr:hypothetical protein [Flavobacterium swingsii]SFA97874.1 hypothetical protein SAMN05660845_1121 [Flavobacterium swingsii]
MKKSAIILLFFLSGITTCFSQVVISKYFDTKIQKVQYQNWVAGVRGGGGGTNVSIEFKEKPSKDFVLNQLYFRNKKVKITESTDNVYFANLVRDINRRVNDEITDDANPSEKEKIIKTPFPISENEAILEYTYKNMKRYYKISKIEEKEMLMYPSAKPIN